MQPCHKHVNVLLLRVRVKRNRFLAGDGVPRPFVVVGGVGDVLDPVGEANIVCLRICGPLPNPLPELRWRGDGATSGSSVKMRSGGWPQLDRATSRQFGIPFLLGRRGIGREGRQTVKPPLFARAFAPLSPTFPKGKNIQQPTSNIEHSMGATLGSALLQCYSGETPVSTG